VGRRLIPISIALVVVSGIAACSSGSTIVPSGAEKSVTDLVYQQTRFRPSDVKCPSGVEAKAGGKFDCHFTGPEGPSVAHVQIAQVHGKRVLFQIRTERTG
jgi:hypothetical protein